LTCAFVLVFAAGKAAFGLEPEPPSGLASLKMLDLQSTDKSRGLARLFAAG
jgi:hypothetical protein